MIKIAFLTAFAFFTFALPLKADDLSAIKAASKGNYNVPVSTALGRDLVQWYRLSIKDTVSFSDAYSFLRNHPNWPSLGAIQIHAEKSLSPAVPTGEVLSYFASYPPVTAPGMMQYLNALIASNQQTKATSVLQNWWVDAALTPGEQKEFISRFGSMLRREDHERRMSTIIHDKFYTNARALAEILGRGYPELIEAKISLIEQKPDVNQRVAAVPAALKNNEALRLARLQWRRKNNEDAGAIELLNNAPAYNQMANPSAWWQERHIIVRRLMEQSRWAEAYRLAAANRQKDGFSFAQAEFVAGWLALRKLNKPWEAFEHFERLFNAVETPISRSRGAYWAGLASEAMNYPDIARQWYEVASKYQTTYYGQIAAQRIGREPAVVMQSALQAPPNAQATFNSDQLVQAANMLNRAGLRREAKLFLYAYTDNSPQNFKYYYAADWAAKNGLNDAALRTAKTAERNGFVMPQHLFPIIKDAASGRYAVHPAFIHGIIRQESAFDQYAQSHAGALGLMQLMPATAEETAQKAGLSYSQSKLTADPLFNMTLGALYIDQMMTRWNDNRTLAIASYNAGPGRVSGWVNEMGDPRNGNIDEVDWIESIPVYETRNYVQRVTEALNVYARILK